jgi:tetratricopeptide (TPR) repeat protein
VLVAGEPGIGKSRLAAEFARTAHAGGAAVLFGRCDEGMGVPYQPFVEALGRDLRQAPQPTLGRLAGELVRLVPEVGERVPGLSPPLRSDPETERYRLFDAVAAWLSAVAATAPLLFVVEDLHWATKPTLLLLAHLLRSDEDLRLLMAVTFRDTPLDMTPDLADLVAELLRLPGVERLRLSGLDESGVGALMEAQAGHELDDEGWVLARIVHGETAGNPFYIREMLALLADKGDIVRREGRWVPGQPLAKLDVPDSLRDVVERRLTHLPDRTSEMLAVAAVLGERFDLGVLAAASGESEGSVVDELRPAVGARLVNETDAGRYQFIHALVRSALEDALGPTRRVQLHRAAGSAVEAVHAGHLEPHLPQLAHHFARAGDVDKAADYASRAGDRALTQLAHNEALTYYASGLDLLDAGGADPADPRRLQLLLGLGEAQRRAGDAGFRQTLLDAGHLARELGATPALARAALANNRGHIYSSGLEVDAARIDVLEAALAAVGDSDRATRARLLATLGMELAWQPDPTRRLASSDEALTLASALGEPATLAHVLLARDYAITAPENAVERFAATTQILALADGLGDPVLTSRALILRFKAAVELADLAEAERCHARNEALVADLGQPFLTWAAMHHRAGLAVLRGDAGAERAINAAHDVGTAAGQADAHFFSFSQKWSLYFDQGRTGELQHYLLAAGERFPENPFPKLFTAIISSEAGNGDRAGVIFDELAATGFAHPTNNVNWLHFSAHCAWLSARLQRPEHVPLLRSRLEPYADQLVAIALGGGIMGTVASYLALLCTTVADWPAAEAYFRAAEAIAERIGAPTWLVRNRVERARMLIARAGRGDAEHAGELLRQALPLARQLRMANIEREAADLLASQ